MKCNNCGLENDENNKFCTSCGSELIAASEPGNIFCQNCGSANDIENIFCISCGAQLKKNIISKTNYDAGNFKNKKHKRKEIHNPYGEGRHKKNNIERKTLNLKPLWITAAIAAIVIIIVISNNVKNDKTPASVNDIVETKSSNPTVESQVYAIASKFVCSCQTCNQLPLESCKCGIAVEERQFIRSSLERNQKPDEIVVALANQYGWLKAEFASQYKVDKSKVWYPGQTGIKTY